MKLIGKCNRCTGQLVSEYGEETYCLNCGFVPSFQEASAELVWSERDKRYIPLATWEIPNSRGNKSKYREAKLKGS